MNEGKIFVCYRRDDSAGHAGRLYDRLNQRFPGRVFMDVTSIDVGTRWSEVIEQMLGNCKVAVVLIGKRWLDRLGDGSRRIDADDDPTRAEIATALRLNLKIVPLLVSGAGVPDRKDLPSQVAAIVDWQALRIDDDDFDHDANRLIKALEGHLGDRSAEPTPDREAQQASVRRLMDDAEDAVRRADWVSAAQTLHAVLSLDRSHRAAAERLAHVQQRSRDISRDIPERTKSGGWFGFSLGSWRVLLVVSAAAVSFMAIGLSNFTNGSGPLVSSAPPDRVSTEPVPVSPGGPRPDPDTTPVAPPQPAAPATPVVPPRPTSPSLAGNYALVGLQQNGVPIAASGQLTLQEAGPGAYTFQMSISAPGIGGFAYAGVLQGSGYNWAQTTYQSNDPSAAIGTPIATQISFDSVQLAAHNQFGQATLWRRQ